jgi:cytochrome o ubiquinol oxidase subunit 3
MTTFISFYETGKPKSHDGDLPSERELGFWLYLMSDAVIFSLLFATYAVMSDAIAGGPTSADLFDLRVAFVETMVLLASTFTFGLASLAAAGRDRRSVILWLAITSALGVTFVAMELSEFANLVRVGAGPERSGFLSAFFVLVGTHGLHVSAGLIWVAVMIAQIRFKGLVRPVRSRLERLGMFWHFLDLIWVGIFSFVYLPGVV